MVAISDAPMKYFLEVPVGLIPAPLKKPGASLVVIEASQPPY